LITGEIEDGVPIITLEVADRPLPMIVDTGFNGDLELPKRFRSLVVARPIGRAWTVLAGGQSIEEDLFLVEIDFDGQMMVAEATFAEVEVGLVGTHLIREYRLTIDFVGRTIRLEHAGEVAGGDPWGGTGA